jgi:hypothetical protein
VRFGAWQTARWRRLNAATLLSGGRRVTVSLVATNTSGEAVGKLFTRFLMRLRGRAACADVRRVPMKLGL